MLIHSAESSVLYDEYHKVFGQVGKGKEEDLKLERRAMEIMREMKRMDYAAKKIEKDGNMDKLENFNNKYIALVMELRKIYAKKTKD